VNSFLTASQRILGYSVPRSCCSCSSKSSVYVCQWCCLELWVGEDGGYFFWWSWNLLMGRCKFLFLGEGNRTTHVGLTFRKNVALRCGCSVPAAEWLDSPTVGTEQLVAHAADESILCMTSGDVALPNFIWDFLPALVLSSDSGSNPSSYSSPAVYKAGVTSRRWCSWQEGRASVTLISKGSLPEQVKEETEGKPANRGYAGKWPLKWIEWR